MSVTNLLQAYAQTIRDRRRANPDVPEPALAPAFQQLLEGLIPLLPVAQGLQVSPEFLNPGVGRPDIALKRIGAPPRAFVELKAPSKLADPSLWKGQDKRQYERFKEFPIWAACNFSCTSCIRVKRLARQWWYRPPPFAPIETTRLPTS
jgi:hypothetical protein